MSKRVKTIAKVVLTILAVILLIVIIAGSFYTVNEQAQAVVTTFGKVTDTKGAGPHFKIPIVQKVEKVNVNITQKITIGYYYDANGELNVVEDESRIMTGDDNIVCVDFFIEWKVSDPVAYLYNSNNPVGILKALSQSCARNIIGSELVDEVLTTGKDRIQSDIEDKIRENLEDYNIGVQVKDVKIQDAEPPNKSVNEAFKAVEDAKLKRETLITQANTYQEEKIPAAKSEADKLSKDAEAYYQTRVAQAQGEVERFNTIYNEYAKYQDVTRTRMYLEVIEKLFPNMNIYINTTDGGTNTLIPIQGLNGTTAAITGSSPLQSSGTAGTDGGAN